MERFKFNNDDFGETSTATAEKGIQVGTEIITCIEFKDRKGEPSCLTDKFKSISQPFRVTMDADYIRDN